MIKLVLEAFGISMIATALLMPFIARLAHRLQIVDIPSPRKIHRKPMPMLGGLAVYVAVVAYESAMGAIAGKVLALVLASGVAVVLGIADDRYDIPSRFRLAIHFALAALLGIGGFRTHLLPYGFDILLSTVWITGMINAVNCFDCADGIVGGMSGIALCCYGVVLVVAAHSDLAFVSFACAGAAFGFLFYNFPPARIFMGDCGSTTFGLLLGAISLRAAADSASPFVLYATLPVALPVGDILLVHIRRYLGGTRDIRDLLASNGKDHMPHRLLQLGFTARQTALFIYLVTAVAGAAAVVVRAFPIAAYLMIAATIFAVSMAEYAYIRRGRVTVAAETEGVLPRPVAVRQLLDAE